MTFQNYIILHLISDCCLVGNVTRNKMLDQHKWHVARERHGNDLQEMIWKHEDLRIKMADQLNPKCLICEWIQLLRIL